MRIKDVPKNRFYIFSCNYDDTISCEVPEAHRRVGFIEKNLS